MQLAGYRKPDERANFKPGWLGWIILAAFIVAGTPMEIAEDPSAAGFALLLRSLAAIVVFAGFVLSFGLRVSNAALTIIFLILAYFLLMNLLGFTKSALMNAAAVGSSLLLLAIVFARGPHREKAWGLLNFLILGYLVFHAAGFLVAYVMWKLTGQIVDLHTMIFPFSAARVGELFGKVRLTGFHLEPGTYANAMYLFVLLRALLRKRLLNMLDLAFMATTVLTFAAWASIGFGFYLIAIAVELFVYEQRIKASYRVVAIVFVGILTIMALPLLAPWLVDSDYIRFIEQKLDYRSTTDSTYYKIQAAEAWLNSFSFRSIFGHALPETYCTYCKSVQDLGMVPNFIFYFGIVPSLVILGGFLYKLASGWGLHFLVVIIPLVFSKFYFYDFSVWLVLGVVLLSKASVFQSQTSSRKWRSDYQRRSSA